MRKAKFKKNNSGSFYHILNKRVKSFFEKNSASSKANGLMLFKIVLFSVLYLFFYIIIVAGLLPASLTVPAVLCFGICHALLGFNIAHDAVHGALFSSAALNRLFSYYFELIGMSSYVWKLKHNLIHHNYPNLQHGDFDIEAGPVLRMSPADKLKPFHKYQYLYAPLVYLLFSITLVFISDIRIMFFTSREKIDGRPHPVFQKVVFIFMKTVYVFLMIILPMILLPYTPLQVIAAFLLMHFSLSLILAFVLIPAHLFEHTQFAEKDITGEIHEEWAAHQMKTTLDYSRKSRICNFLLGGFNINVVHHLFPRICHVHLIPVSEIVKQTAAEFGIIYHETSIGQAIRSHFKMLKLLGQTENPFQKKS